MWRASVLARSGLCRNLFFRVYGVDALAVESALDRRLAGNECASTPCWLRTLLGSSCQVTEARMCLAELSCT